MTNDNNIVIDDYYTYMNEKKSNNTSYLELLKLTTEYFVKNDLPINRDDIRQYADLYMLKHNIPILDIEQYVDRYFKWKQ
tara:strand:+ start:1148 stop:1387 length:240 start_codon:yes stop_codon:yes gene_type:complete